MRNVLIILLFLLNGWQGINAALLSAITAVIGSNELAAKTSAGFLPGMWPVYLCAFVAFAVTLDKTILRWIEQLTKFIAAMQPTTTTDMPMKTVAIIALLTAVTIGSFTACTTQQISQANKYAGIAKMAAYDGTSLWLKDHPQDRDKFVLAQNKLAQLSASTNVITSDDLILALADLPIKELKSSSGSLILNNAVMLYDLVADKQVVIDVSQIKPITDAVYGGIAMGLK